jgi:hypothetical protein
MIIIRSNISRLLPQFGLKMMMFAVDTVCPILRWLRPGIREWYVICINLVSLDRFTCVR